jgi:hypothetical protein
MIIEQAINMKPAFLVVDGWTMIKRGGKGDGMFKVLLGTDNGQGAHHVEGLSCEYAWDIDPGHTRTMTVAER